MEPDFAKVRAAVERLCNPGQTPKALELINGQPVHIMPKSIRMKLPPVDSARRKQAGKINLSAARSSFNNPHFLT